MTTPTPDGFETTARKMVLYIPPDLADGKHSVCVGCPREGMDAWQLHTRFNTERDAKQCESDLRKWLAHELRAAASVPKGHVRLDDGRDVKVCIFTENNDGSIFIATEAAQKGTR
jgi:hypothetical protein